MDLGLYLPLPLQDGCQLLVLPASVVSQATQVDELSRRRRHTASRAVGTTDCFVLSQGGGVLSNTLR